MIQGTSAHTASVRNATQTPQYSARRARIPSTKKRVDPLLKNIIYLSMALAGALLARLTILSFKEKPFCYIDGHLNAVQNYTYVPQEATLPPCRMSGIEAPPNHPYTYEYLAWEYNDVHHLICNRELSTEEKAIISQGNKTPNTKENINKLCKLIGSLTIGPLVGALNTLEEDIRIYCQQHADRYFRLGVGKALLFIRPYSNNLTYINTARSFVDSKDVEKVLKKNHAHIRQHCKGGKIFGLNHVNEEDRYLIIKDFGLDLLSIS